MYDWQKHQLLEYMHEVDIRLENDLIVIYNRMRARSLDNIDCIELMEANVRLQTTRELFQDMHKILRGWR